MSRLKNYQRSLILAVVLAILAFFWIWLYQGVGANGYWAALIAFAVYVASGAVASKLPWMVLGGVAGIILGFLTFALANLLFPPYAALSAAFAGAIFLLIAALVGIPKMKEIFPMTVVGWACFIAAMARWDYLFSNQPIWANIKTFATVGGVFLSLMVGLLAAALVATPLLGAATQKQAAAGQAE